jgi:hypothetical protein
VLKRVLLVLLLFFLAVAVGLGLLFLAWIRQWTPWIALAGPGIFLLLPLFWYLGKLLSSVFARRRYADTVLGRGAALPDAAAEDSRLRQDWERGIAELRPRGRSTRSDPAGAFPWFLVAGPQGSGRHGILRGAGPPLNPDPAAPLEGPEGCSWYFFERAVYVAVRGLYERFPEAARGTPRAGAALPAAVTGPGLAPPSGEAAAMAQSGAADDVRSGLCALLRETGRKVPLQGVVSCVPAELLKPEREAELRDLAFQTGQILERLAEELDFSPPVYVFVTGLHLEPGWGEALDRLSREGETLGAMFGAGGDEEGLSEEAAGAIRSEIRDLLVEVMDLDPGGIAPFLSAPGAAEELQRPLSVLLGALQNPAGVGISPRIMGLFVSLPPVSADPEALDETGAPPVRGGPALAVQGSGGAGLPGRQPDGAGQQGTSGQAGTAVPAPVSVPARPAWFPGSGGEAGGAGRPVAGAGFHGSGAWAGGTWLPGAAASGSGIPGDAASGSGITGDAGWAGGPGRPGDGASGSGIPGGAAGAGGARVPGAAAGAAWLPGVGPGAGGEGRGPAGGEGAGVSGGDGGAGHGSAGAPDGAPWPHGLGAAAGTDRTHQGIRPRTPVTGGSSERLLAETLPEMAYLSRRTNRSGARRQRTFLRGVIAGYLAMAVAALLIAKNVDYQKGASRAMAEMKIASAAAAVPAVADFGRSGRGSGLGAVPGAGGGGGAPWPGAGDGAGAGGGFGAGSGALAGSGHGAGFGEGSRHGAGFGEVSGHGAGFGEGSRHGAGFGEGSGHGAGFGEGSRHGAGFGEGSARGAGSGEGSARGAGFGEGSARGAGSGQGGARGDGSGQGGARGDGSGEGAVNGPGVVPGWAARGTAELERADAAIYLLSRLETYDRGVRLRGIGPDPAGDIRGRLEGLFSSSFEEATSAITLALRRQMEAVSDPDSDLFAVTFRQLLFMFAAYSGRMDELSLEAGAGVEDMFPALPEGLDVESRPLWNFTYARLLATLVERARYGEVPGSRNKRILGELNDAVDRAMELRGEKSYDWLMDWTERAPQVRPVTVASFWAPHYTAEEVQALVPSGAGTVRGACTAAGRAFIVEAANLIEAAGGQASGAAGVPPLSGAGSFIVDYDTECLSQWRDFQRVFSGVVASRLLGLAGLEAFRELRSGGESSPGSRAAEVMSDNLRSFRGGAESPVWLRNLEIGRAAARWSRAKAGWREAAGFLQKVRALGPVAAAARDQIGDVYYRTDFVRRAYEAEKDFTRYSEAISEILKTLSENPEESFRLAALNFGGPAAAPQPAPAAPGAPPAQAAEPSEPFRVARESLDLLAAKLYRDEGDVLPDSFMLRMRTSEFRALEGVLVDTAARTIDRYWESDVILPGKFLSAAEDSATVFGKDGLILKFLTGKAAPFLDSAGPGFSARSWEGRTFPFTEDFLKLVSVGGGPLLEAQPDSYKVNVTVTATLAGDEALEKPQRTVITLKTPDEVQQMVNYNYPSSQVFSWKPGADAETSLEIDLPSLTLMVSWGGPEGFPSFLNDLVTQNFELYPRDFPEHRAQLESLGISRIRVLMKADGALPVIKYLNLPRPVLPVSIVSTSQQL